MFVTDIVLPRIRDVRHGFDDFDRLALFQDECARLAGVSKELVRDTCEEWAFCEGEHAVDQRRDLLRALKSRSTACSIYWLI